MIPAWTFENPPWNNQFDDCPIQTSMFGDFQWWHWRVLSIAAPKKVPESVKPGWFPTLPHIFPIFSPYFPHIFPIYLLHIFSMLSIFSSILFPIVSRIQTSPSTWIRLSLSARDNYLAKGGSAEGEATICILGWGWALREKWRGGSVSMFLSRKIGDLIFKERDWTKIDQRSNECGCNYLKMGWQSSMTYMLGKSWFIIDMGVPSVETRPKIVSDYVMLNPKAIHIRNLCGTEKKDTVAPDLTKFHVDVLFNPSNIGRKSCQALKIEGTPDLMIFLGKL